MNNANKSFSFLEAQQEFALRDYSHEDEDSFRSKFQRDRDRILFSKEFRRLVGKTQVFVSSFDDHIRNRLTHTLEVSQISQTIAKYFGLNMTLAEAISLGHDVGHTPFGHVGERILNLLTNNCDLFKDFKIENDSFKGFKHNWQGIKVVSTLEKISPKYKGLNLTDYTIWGILNHSKLEYPKCVYCANQNCNYMHNNLACPNDGVFVLENYYSYKKFYSYKSWTFEALVVSIADEIAQRHHDIEDGLLAGIIDKKELVDVFTGLFKEYLGKDEKRKLRTIKNSNNNSFVNHDLSSLMLGFYSINLISNTEVKIKELLDKYKFSTFKEFDNLKETIFLNEKIFCIVNFDENFMLKDNEFKQYLYNRILNSYLAQSMDGKASYLLRKIFHAYLTNPKQLPDSTIVTFFSNFLTSKEFKILIKNNKSQSFIQGRLRDELNNLHNANNHNTYKSHLIRTIVDLIAGMTDAFAIDQYKFLYEGKQIRNYY